MNTTHVRVFKFPCYYDSENVDTIFCLLLEVGSLPCKSIWGPVNRDLQDEKIEWTMQSLVQGWATLVLPIAKTQYLIYAVLA